MTYEERVEMFSKDYLTIADIQILLGIASKAKASTIMCDIKRGLKLSPKYNGQGVRLDIQGKLHVQDYLDYYHLPSERYVFNPQNIYLQQERKHESAESNCNSDMVLE